MSRHQTGFSTEGAGEDLVPYPSPGGGGSQVASGVPYDNTASGLTASDVQAAIDEIADSPPGPYTDEDARDAIGLALVEGDGITITVADGGNTITIECTITQYTDGMADARAAAAIATHEAAGNPHPVYLTQAEGDGFYAPLVHDHDADYEPIGAVAAHEAAGNPHPVYLTAAEGNAAYAPVLGADDNYVTDAEKVKLSNLSGTNTGDQTLPVKATGAEVDTGTDDAKFVTAKALLDSSYITSAQGDASYAAIANAYSDEKVDDRVDALIQDGRNLVWTYSDAGGTLTGNVDTLETASPMTTVQTVATGRYQRVGARYQLTGTNRLSITGTGRVRIDN